MPEFAAAEIRGRSFKILADVELTDDSEGVLLANGARFGGHTLFIKDRKLWYVNNFLGIPPEQQLVSPDALPSGSHVLGVEFTKESHGGHGEALGTATLYVDDLAVAKGEWKTQPGHFALCGEGLTVGRDIVRPGHARSTARRTPSPAAGSRWSRSTSATTCTSTASATSTPRCPATDNHPLVEEVALATVSKPPRPTRRRRVQGFRDRTSSFTSRRA